MMEMTMDFPVKNTNELNGISPGDEITFTLSWVRITSGLRISIASDIPPNNHQHDVHANGHVRRHDDPFLKPGDLLPDYTLTAEDGRQIHFSDFRGKVLAFTFFFTRCPLPDYCPRMNNNFEETRKILLADANAPTNWQFLSISFDPGFDTPEVLASYASIYRGDDTNHWLFASAPTNMLADAAARLDLMIMRQGNNISHNMRTVVLDPQGAFTAIRRQPMDAAATR